jgi:hypothetical protein
LVAAYVRDESWQLSGKLEFIVDEVVNNEIAANRRRKGAENVIVNNV